ncbi:hypothetical protein A2943_00175 [Candidatus Adlerbacteria bacterium RIFCSPLOWO2_01_FULL_51_16]|uniref:Glycosyl transferase family 1 domain-containing protein n=1 Tax=Candidatus Adlerbacteria bacterium RIFCSPLOWO2_01_FULL_51_16 TaxID=1797243 RepID=A0A1F4XF26_9BACT|nr:MAG: hypothetical protein A2943_00175 [Candidatus Adlerbacteria bacterium RIFCSPLOWO2_01_FULL_51_16]
MKKVLIFSLAYFPHVGGAEIAIKEITDRIADIEFHLITLRFRNEPRREKIGNVYVHRVGGGASYFSKILFVPIAAFAAARLHRKHHFDAVWAMMSYMVFPLVLSRPIGVKTPYVLTLQDGDPFEVVFKRFYIRLLMPLLRYGFRHATVIQTISQYLLGWARTFDYKGPIEVIPNGVDIERFAKPQERFEVRKTLNIRENETILITTSRLAHKNAIDDVLRALPELPAVHFLVLGEGSEEIKLKKLSKELGVASRVRFLGHITHKELPAYLQASTIFVRPSRSEGMGSSFIEAMAAGIPVIATQEGGIADFLYDAKRNPGKEQTGFAVDTDSPEQIVQAVQEILNNPEQTKKVAEHAQKLVFENYDWNLIAGKMQERVFKKVL